MLGTIRWPLSAAYLSPCAAYGQVRQGPGNFHGNSRLNEYQNRTGPASRLVPSVVSFTHSAEVVIQMEFVPNHSYKPYKQQQQQQQPHHQPDSSECFRKGAYIELSNGALRRVEDIRTEDFIQSALRSQLFDLREATVVRIDRGHLSHVTITFSYDTRYAKVNMDVLPGHPLFVYGQGWASCNPQLSFQLYELKCQQLQVGDICLSLVPREQIAPPPPPPPPPAPIPAPPAAAAPPQVPHRGYHSYQMYAEMANFVAAYTQHVIDKLRN
ncbi:uncharacterized protein LOC117581217 [Drosophila guanche]|uniref:Blast:Ataxin-1 n=1 Tax=Drosophila guanche TaxID=7266 RepID=A0A3B0K4P4_DROGU|nr:uncharacterized protein LOC117581217 [Drosophila guanche]SPP78438.1 blast:Ataxin-1 [Drosophila guanche]